MSSFSFRYPTWLEIDANAWVNRWAETFLADKQRQADDRVYLTLIRKMDQLSGDDFELIGRWKEGCIVDQGAKEHGKWKPNTSAGYEVWMEAKRHPPQRPLGREIDAAFGKQFLDEWSEKTYRAPTKGGIREPRFGVARAATLLHFMSWGKYPIYDSFIWYAFQKLGTPLPWNVTVDVYLKKFCPLISLLAATCGLSQNITDLRKLDNALRCLGRDQFPMSAISDPVSLQR